MSEDLYDRVCVSVRVAEVVPGDSWLTHAPVIYEEID